MQSQYTVLNYRIGIYFHHYKFAMMSMNSVRMIEILIMKYKDREN